ncbi:hypothetical protein KJ657_00010 [Patescibacteria group bacterium]|nr:hypothetical protein [Nanoarchaeota archaeon]MBU1015462.1 hypothetical protein [Patescibacteria group bacterium]MBU1938296.1 hypothetical protein [Patescibacteria group bacterium]
MNTQRKNVSHHTRLTGTLAAVILLIPVFAGQANARIVFEDDAAFNIQSEGIIMDSNNNAGTDTIELQFGNDGTDATITYDPTTQDITFAAPGGDFLFSDDNITTTGDTSTGGLSSTGITTLGNGTATVQVDSTSWDISAAGIGSGFTGFTSTGIIDFAGATRLALHQGAANPATCTEGDVFYNITDNLLYLCTALNTWTAAGPQDFEAVYNYDGDSTLTTTNADFTIDTGTADFLVTSNDWTVDASGNIDVEGTITAGSGNNTITNAVGLLDASVSFITDTFNKYTSTTIDGALDEIGSTAAGDGATIVGIEDASAWFTGADVETALNEIEALFGAATSATFNFTENNVLADDDPVYTALNKLDLKWGDLGSVATGEGASLVSIEDAGGYTAVTDVENALQELYASVGSGAPNVEDMTFYPEYPDATIYPDGTNNRGTLESFYDATEETGYYNWVSDQVVTQDIDIRFQFPLPTDFSATGDFTFRYRTGSAVEADNDVEVRLYNLTDTTECANDLTNGTAGTWATGTIAAASINTGCTGGTALNAGDIVEVQMKLYDNSGAGDYADIGQLVWNYTN